uniref:Uncharacterized protein n=1 Tax=Peronospora matthiolae TaxID=2874970 RepID=A0AAV1VAU8_9STRA
MKPYQDYNTAPRLDAFSDADFAGDRADKKSMTGGVLLRDSMPVSWGARKQGDVSLSTMEADLVPPARSRGKC